MHKLVIDKYAQKQLGKITAPHFNRIIKAINGLSEIPDRSVTENLQVARVTESGLVITGPYTILKIKSLSYL